MIYFTKSNSKFDKKTVIQFVYSFKNRLNLDSCFALMAICAHCLALIIFYEGTKKAKIHYKRDKFILYFCSLFDQNLKNR